MPYPRKVTTEQRALLREIALTRRHVAEIYKALPSNKRLACEMGVSRGAIEQILVQELAAHDEELGRLLADEGAEVAERRRLREAECAPSILDSGI